MKHKRNNNDKVSVPGIVDVLLAKGTYTRKEIMAEVAKQRPDFKDPSAAVSNGMRRLQDKDQTGGIKEVPRAARASRSSSKSMFTKEDRIKREFVRHRADFAVGAKRREDESKIQKPKMKRVWPE